MPRMEWQSVGPFYFLLRRRERNVSTKLGDLLGQTAIQTTLDYMTMTILHSLGMMSAGDDGVCWLKRSRVVRT